MNKQRFVFYPSSQHLNLPLHLLDAVDIVYNLAKNNDKNKTMPEKIGFKIVEKTPILDIFFPLPFRQGDSLFYTGVTKQHMGNL